MKLIGGATGSLVLLFVLGGCVSYKGNREFVPFFEIDRHAAETAGAGKLARADAESAETAGANEYVVRPIGSFETIGSERRRLKLLWPIFDLATGASDTRAMVLPIFYYRSRPYLDGKGRDLDWFALLLFFGGSDPNEGRHFAIFPLGGKINGLLGKDSIRFALFPLYWQTRERELDSLHVVWPIFNRVSGGGQSGWRIWPLYGWHDADTKEGRPRFRRHFAVWPFYVKQRNGLDTARPTDVFMTLPFYGQSINERTESRTYLWPFFDTTLDVETGNKLYWGYLLPYRFTGGQFDLWPLFGTKKRLINTEFGSGDSRGIAAPGGKVGFEAGEPDPERVRRGYRQFALWPIQRYDVTEYRNKRQSRFWLLPLFWRFRTEDQESAELTKEIKLWPLWRYRRSEERTTFYFPSPLWFRQENLFERLYARLWRLVLYQNTPERSGWEFLYGFLSSRVEKEDNSQTLSLFYGLLEWEGRPDGNRFRVLYFPWR